ncbi:MAG: anhydro-N-acetylmuramic acid kinase [Bernardetiaceae bacterium]|nr:anhydro-N-acetylmuramic acid kinase [Bernardetiaceae bacterium]
MNPHLARLYAIAQKPERLIVGLMSGTSVDGLDVALCRFTGQGTSTRPQLLEFATVPYEPSFRQNIKTVFSKREVDLETLTLLNPWVALQHTALVRQCLENWHLTPNQVDLLASHGQTIYHAPRRLHQRPGFGNATLQIGDGDHLAVATGIITISDFRQKHIAGGGEGAPLAAYGDYLIFSQAGQNRIMLNIGGIANFTYLPGSLNADEVFSTDVGPGNTLMDALVQRALPGRYFDDGAQIARAGEVNGPLLAQLENHPFFAQPFPKTTGPELFSLAYLDAACQATGTTGLPLPHLMATLNRFSANRIAQAIGQAIGPRRDFVVFVSGGGMHNPLLMSNIQEQLPRLEFRTTAQLAINPDAKEAVLFAVLANECVGGGRVSYGSGRNGIPSVSLGKISFPG